jgi:hypothetical protein
MQFSSWFGVLDLLVGDHRIEFCSNQNVLLAVVKALQSSVVIISLLGKLIS